MGFNRGWWLDGLTWIDLHAGFIVDAVDSWHCETKIATAQKGRARNLTWLVGMDVAI